MLKDCKRKQDKSGLLQTNKHKQKPARNNTKTTRQLNEVNVTNNKQGATKNKSSTVHKQIM